MRLILLGLSPLLVCTAATTSQAESYVVGATSAVTMQAESLSNTGALCSIATSDSGEVSRSAVGNPLAGGNQGIVYTYDAQDYSVPQQVITPSSDIAARGFGSSLAFLADVNGDQYDELVVGAPGDSSAFGGTVSVFLSQVTSGSIQYVICGYLAGPTGFGSEVGGSSNNTSHSLLVVNSSARTLEQFRITLSQSGQCEFSINSDSSLVLTDLATPQVIECPTILSSEVASSAGSIDLDATPLAVVVTSTPTVAATAEIAEPTPAPTITGTETATPLPTGTNPSGGSGTHEVFPPGSDSGGSGTGTTHPSLDSSSQIEEPLTIAPGSENLPAPTVVMSEMGATVQMPSVKPLLSLQQKRRAVRQLSQRLRIKRSRAMKLLNNPDNYRSTYIIEYSQVSVARLFSLINDAYAAPAGKRSSKVRQIRTRQNTLALRSLRPGFTYRLSYRVEISLRRARFVVGVTKPSPAVTFKVR